MATEGLAEIRKEGNGQEGKANKSFAGRGCGHSGSRKEAVPAGSRMDMASGADDGGVVGRRRLGIGRWVGRARERAFRGVRVGGGMRCIPLSWMGPNRYGTE